MTAVICPLAGFRETTASGDLSGPITAVPRINTTGKLTGAPTVFCSWSAAFLLEEVFASREPDEVMFLRWNGEDPPADLMKWLQKALPDARPASRMETLDRRPLGARTWYRDKSDGQFGSLLEITVKPAGKSWNVRIRDTVGPFLAGGGHETNYTKHYGYWMGKTASSWAE